MNFIEQAEKEFAAYFGKRYGVMMCNGTATLHCCLLAAGVGPGDEVIVPALTMASPALAVRYCGAKPVYADIGDFYHYNITAETIHKKITDKTKAIIAVSLYGFRISDKVVHSGKSFIPVIEDAAQCINSECRTSMTSFSFQETKHISCGEGGMVLTNDEMYARKLRSFSNLGYNWPIDKEDIVKPDYTRHNLIGFNYRPSESQAKLLLKQIPLIPGRIKQRQDVAKMYLDVITEIGLPDHGVSGAINCSYWTFPLVMNPENWRNFGNQFRKNGGDRVYGAWRLPYTEPALYDDTQSCPNAERLQPCILQFKTNYTDLAKAEEQAKILRKTIYEYRV